VSCLLKPINLYFARNRPTGSCPEGVLRHRPRAERVGSRSTALCLDKLDNQGGDGEAVQPEKTPALTVFYHPHSWHCDRNCNTATVFPFDRTNSTLREK